ncbi:MAG TPA: NUDIX hydrolase [Candidatus Sulfotelmatobacter sp.]|jgi:ADP-ribose pyrophosphatase|nr:NUDIX hydrolase [Candidatus Sulfotelmatobacter sp.]
MMKILSIKTVFTSKYFRIKHIDIDRNGKHFSKDFVDRDPVVFVIPYTASNEIYLESQYRDALQEMTLEVVAGSIEDTEDPLTAAMRELKEETGFIAKKWDKIAEWNTSSNTVAKMHLFAATDLEKGKKNLDDDEEISLIKLPLETILEKIENGELTIATHIAALAIFDRFRKEGKL